WHYLEHDYHPDQTLQKLSDRSKGDTLLFIEVPNYDSLSRVKYGAKWAGWHTPRHTFLYQPSSITSLLNRSGWEVVSIESKGTLNDYALYWMSEMEQRGIDWSQNLENEFWGFVKGMMIHKAKNILPSQRSHGVMLVIARRR
ncbi:MAG: methyltransferase domain-containing protein, partial [Bacteroidota bacterium]